MQVKGFLKITFTSQWYKQGSHFFTMTKFYYFPMILPTFFTNFLVSVQIQISMFVVRPVGSAFIICTVSGTGMHGECTRLGFILGEHGLCIASADA